LILGHWERGNGKWETKHRGYRTRSNAGYPLRQVHDVLVVNHNEPPRGPYDPSVSPGPGHGATSIETGTIPEYIEPASDSETQGMVGRLEQHQACVCPAPDIPRAGITVVGIGGSEGNGVLAIPDHSCEGHGRGTHSVAHVLVEVEGSNRTVAHSWDQDIGARGLDVRSDVNQAPGNLSAAVGLDINPDGVTLALVG
jgi:hypothetical protein